jgi:hypothetical protein
MKLMPRLCWGVGFSVTGQILHEPRLISGYGEKESLFAYTGGLFGKWRAVSGLAQPDKV